MNRLYVRKVYSYQLRGLLADIQRLVCNDIFPY